MVDEIDGCVDEIEEGNEGGRKEGKGLCLCLRLLVSYFVVEHWVVRACLRFLISARDRG